MEANNMTSTATVTRAEWLNARRAFLAKEKEFTRLRDELSRARRDLPRVKVDKNYKFNGPNGSESLADLFQGRSQLIVYHFMFDPSWDEGCPSCSYIADHFSGAIPHLAARDVTLVPVSRAPLAKLSAFQKRLGWAFKWVSSEGSDFNYDYGVTFRPDDRGAEGVEYNYGRSHFPANEAPGLSVFIKEKDGTIYHTYSSYSRGLDILIGAYNYLDLTPKGRDEDSLDYSMAWVKHNDKY